jgi:hypothetical protein
MRPMRYLVLVLCLAAPSVGSSAMLQRRGPAPEAFGKPLEVYDYRPGYVLIVTRDINQDITELVVEPVSVMDRSVEPTRNLGDDEFVLEMIDELAPEASRGMKNPWFGLTMCSFGCTTNFGFENVDIYRVGHPNFNSQSRDRLVLRWKVKPSYSPSAQSN